MPRRCASRTCGCSRTIELDQSIEVARAQQEVSLAVDDVLPMLDALVSTLLGWRTIQPGLNPVRPEVFVRALQSCLSQHVPDASVREFADRACRRPAGREPAPALSRAVRLAALLRGRAGGAHRRQGAQGQRRPAASRRRTRWRRRCSRWTGCASCWPAISTQAAAPGFPLHGAGVDGHAAGHEAGRRAGQQARAAAQGPGRAACGTCWPRPAAAQDAAPRLGVQLGEEVVRLMFDNLAQDKRLLPEFKRQLKAIEPAC